jgi:hypothetical protein
MQHKNEITTVEMANTHVLQMLQGRKLGYSNILGIHPI